MGRPERIQFFITNAHDCSYLRDQKATALFADPYSSITPATFGSLMTMGFRRSGEYIYKPRCASCQACIPVRIPVNQFHPSRSQKRLIKKNQRITATIGPAQYREEDYAIYDAYIKQKHSDGGMHPPSPEQYQSFLFCSWSNTHFVRFFVDQQLCAVAVTDRLEAGLSAVYTFFDPEFDQLSLGTHAILWQIDYCKANNIPYLYLGYWIKACRKMAYKNQFLPFEMLEGDQWIQVKKKSG